MRKLFLLLLMLISFTFTGCTVQGDNLTSINKELSALELKLTQLEAENLKLQNELLQIKTESEHMQVITDESGSIDKPTQTLTSTPDPAPSSMPTPTIKPTPTPTSKTTIQPTEKKEITVYVTKTGAKYHSSGCRYLSKSKIPISLSSAKNHYTPCSVCNPPR